MNHLRIAAQTVQPALKGDRIGTPVFARIVAHTVEDHGRIEPLLGTALQTAADWMGEKVARVAALGSIASGQITVLATFARGQTALVSAGTHGTSPPLVEATVIGNRGALSWEPAAAAGGGKEAEMVLSDEGRRLLDAARRSLDLESPVDLSSGKAVAPPARRETPAVKDQSPTALKKTAPPYGVLLIAGHQTHQENYARSLAADKRCRLIAVSDDPGVTARRRELNEALARELKISHLPNYAEALARDDVHIVSICAEPDRRAEIIVRCAQAGKHVYLDKPLCATRDEVSRIVAAVRKAGVVNQMFSLVRTPAAARTRELIAGGSLGNVAALQLDMTFAKGFPGSASLERPRAEDRSLKLFEATETKRELYNIGVYPLVLLHWALGRKVKQVYGVTGNYFFAEHQRGGMEDFGALLLKLDEGAVASVLVARTGWRSHPSSGLNRNYVIGSKGVAVVDAYRPRIEVWPEAEAWQPPRRHDQDPMGFWTSTTTESGAKPKTAWLTPASDVRDEFAYFLDCVEQGRTSDVSAELAAEVNNVLLAAYESAATGGYVAM